MTPDKAKELAGGTNRLSRSGGRDEGGGVSPNIGDHCATCLFWHRGRDDNAPYGWCRSSWSEWNNKTTSWDFLCEHYKMCRSRAALNEHFGFSADGTVDYLKEGM